MTTIEDLSGLVHGDIPPTPKTDQPIPGRGRGRPRKDPAEPTPTKLDAGKTPAKELPMPPKGTIASSVGNMYTMMGMGVMPFRPQTAAAIVANSDECGKAWEELARTNPAVRKALLGLMTTSAWGGVAAAHLPIVMALMAEGKPKTTEPKHAADAPPPSRGFKAGNPAANGGILRRPQPKPEPKPEPTPADLPQFDLAYSPPPKLDGDINR